MLVISSRIDWQHIPGKTAFTALNHAIRPCINAVRVKNGMGYCEGAEERFGSENYGRLWISLERERERFSLI
jgi:hypothetical protein